MQKRVWEFLIKASIILLCSSSSFFAFASGLHHESDTVLDVKAFGATGDGRTDDTNAFSSALQTLAEHGGGTLIVPSGTYVVADLRIGSNTAIKGIGVPRPTLVKRSDAATILNLSGELVAGSRQPLRNITVESLILRGRSVEDGFKEHIHNLIAIGVTRLIVHDVFFAAFQGDGLYIGSRLDPSEHVLHNSDIIVSNNEFSGTNAQNRNGISIIDCSRCIFEHNWFGDITRSKMPGAIDIEPNRSDEVIRDIVVRNNTVQHTNGTAAFSLALLGRGSPACCTHVIFEGNYVEHANVGIFVAIRSAQPKLTQLDLVIRNNMIRSVTQPLTISDFSGWIHLAGNHFSDGPAGAAVACRSACRISFAQNDFLRVGSESSGGILLSGKLSSVDFRNNSFTDAGPSRKQGGAIYFASVPINKLEVVRNKFASPNHVTHSAVGAASDAKFTGDRVIWTGDILEDGIQAGVLSQDSGRNHHDLGSAMPL